MFFRLFYSGVRSGCVARAASAVPNDPPMTAVARSLGPDEAMHTASRAQRVGHGKAWRQCCCSEVLRSSSTHALSRSIAMTLSAIVRSISARRHSSTADKIALTRLSSASLLSLGGGRHHPAGSESRPLRCSAWRRYHVRRDISSLSQGFRASMVRARSSMRGRPFFRGGFLNRTPTGCSECRS
jgi:hypothetical protein